MTSVPKVSNDLLYTALVRDVAHPSDSTGSSHRALGWFDLRGLHGKRSRTGIIYVFWVTGRNPPNPRNLGGPGGRDARNIYLL